MRKKRIIAVCMAAAVVAGLTACGEKPQGGSLTKQGMEAIEALDYAGALADFQKAAANGEDAVPALRGMGMAYMGMADYENAIEAFSEALKYTDHKMQETVQDILLYKASAQYRMRDYEGTAETCEELLKEEQTESADACFLRGASYLCLGYQDRAKEDFDRAVALSPQDYTLYLNIYESYEGQQLSAVGDEYLQTALNIPPKRAEDYYCIGQIYYYLEQYDQAQQALLSPVEEKYLPALTLMGRIYLAQGDYARAMSLYESIRQEVGESTQLYNGLAMCCLEAGEYDQAIAYIEQGLQLGEEIGKQELLFNEIVAYEKKLDFTTAKVKAENYVALYPTDEAGQKEYTFLKTR